MDSGNSGSLQSSSGGDEDYDSSSGGGGADHSPFLMSPFSSSSSSAAAPSSTAGFFAGDTNLSSSATYLSFVNNIMIPQLPNLPSMSSSSPYHHHHHLHLNPEAPVLNQIHPIPPPSTAVAAAEPSSSGGAVVTKNPKKRTRASRRAPTTVLTTDTTNFRAMVQEFTGVPAPPFSTGHAYSSLRRFDIFRSPPPPRPPSSSSSVHNLDSFYSPFRSTSQKAQTMNPSSLSPSDMNHHSNIAISMASPSMNFHSLPDLPLPKLPIGTQNTQVPTFQSLVSQQQHHQPVSSLHELNTMNLGSLRQDQERDRDHHHRLMIGQVGVPLSSSSSLPEFDRREKLTEINNNVSSSSSSIRGTNTATTTTVDPWICPTD